MEHTSMYGNYKCTFLFESSFQFSSTAFLPEHIFFFAFLFVLYYTFVFIEFFDEHSDKFVVLNCHYYVGHLESKERLRIQPAQLFNFS